MLCIPGILGFTYLPDSLGSREGQQASLSNSMKGGLFRNNRPVVVKSGQSSSQHYADRGMLRVEVDA